MAVGIPRLLTDGSFGTSGQTEVTTSVFSPAADSMIVAFFSAKNSDNTPDGLVGISGSANWEHVKHTSGFDRERITCWWGTQPTPTSESVTFTAPGADTWDNMYWAILEIPGAAVEFPAQSLEEYYGYVNTGTEPYTSSTAETSMCLSCWKCSGGTYEFAEYAGWTEIVDRGFGGEDAFEVHWATGSFTEISSSITGTAYIWSLGLEILEAQEGGVVFKPIVMFVG